MGANVFFLLKLIFIVKIDKAARVIVIFKRFYCLNVS